MKKKLLFLVPVLLGMFLSACGGGGSTNPPEDSSGGGTEPGGDPTKSDLQVFLEMLHIHMMANLTFLLK